jgi:hypothetical protein
MVLKMAAVPLSSLFTTSLSNASKAFLLPTIDDSTQARLLHINVLNPTNKCVFRI